MTLVAPPHGPVVADRPILAPLEWRRASIAALAATLVGAAGPLGAVFEYGPLVVHRPVAETGRTVLLVLLPCMWLGAWSLGRVRWAQPLTVVVSCAVLVPLTATNIGRVHAVVAVAVGSAMLAVLVDWRPTPAAPGRRHRIEWLALPPVVAAAWVWAYLTILPLTLGLVVLSVATCELAARRPGLLAGPDEWVRRRLPGAARRVALAGGSWCARSAAVSVHLARRLVGAATSWVQARVLGTEPGRRWLVGVVLGLCLAPMIARLTDPSNQSATVLGINDHPLHLDAARSLRLVPFDPGVPHFLFHLLTGGAALVVGHRWAPTLVLGGALAATFVVTAVLMRRAPDGAARLGATASLVTAAAVLVMETPTLWLIRLGVVPDDTLFQGVQAWYSPTWIVALPLSIAWLLVVDLVLDDDLPARGQPSLGHGGSLAVLTVAGALAKPSFLLCAVPGLGLLLLARRTPLRASARLMTWVAAPLVPVLWWQATSLNRATTEIGGGGVTFDPISGPPFGWSSLSWTYLLPLLWIPLALVVTHGSFLRERLVQLVGSGLVVAVIILLCFRETGPRAGHGNLGVSAQVCTTLLVMLSVRSCAVAISDGRRVTPALRALTLATAVVFVASGILAVFDAMGWWDVPIDWSALG